MVKKYSVGIDIAAKTLAICVVNGPSEVLMNLSVGNDVQGIKSMLAQLKKAGIKPKDCWFCFEHTGHYGLQLSCLLQQAKQTYSIVSALEIKQSQGVRRGKTDAADARQIAVYAAIHRHKLQPCVLPEKGLLLIKELLSLRGQQVKIRTQLKNTLGARKLVGSVIDNEWMLKDIKAQIAVMDTCIKRLDKAIVQEITKHASLEQNYKLAKSVKGIGPVIAAAMVVHTCNFTSFDSSRKFSSYAGLAPFRHESGESIRGKTKVSNYANKRLKTLLYSAASSAINHDPELKNYYQRKRAEKKVHHAVLNAVAFKLVCRIFAVIKRKSPYVTTYAQKNPTSLLVMS